MSNRQVIENWIEETDLAIMALEEWRRKLLEWQEQGCDSGMFHAALFTLRSAGLKEWADRNEADLDRLAYAATCLGSGQR